MSELKFDIKDAIAAQNKINIRAEEIKKGNTDVVVAYRDATSEESVIVYCCGGKKYFVDKDTYLTEKDKLENKEIEYVDLQNLGMAIEFVRENSDA